MAVTILGWEQKKYPDRVKPVWLVKGTASGTSGTTVDIGARKIWYVQITRYHSTYSADSLVVEPEISGGGFKIRVTDKSSGAENTTTTVYIYWEMLVEKE